MSLYLRKVVKKVAEEANKLSIYIKEIERHLVFVGFKEDNLPQVTIRDGDEIILVYRGSKISAQIFMEIMEEVGYITKNDFIL